MKFSLDASGAQAMGNGIGSIFKAMAMAPMMRQQAEQNAALRSAQTYGANMTGNKAGAQAEQERYTLGQRQAPVDTGLPDYLQTAQRIFQMTGDTNAERVANAGTAVQTQGIRGQALAAVDDLDRMNRLNALAKPGTTYMPFDDVGNTGRALNKATGEGAVLDDVLAKLFDNELRTEAGANTARAAASHASAGNSSANAAYTRAKHGHFTETGRLPGAAGGGEDATNAKTRNAVIAAVEKEGASWGWTDDQIMAEVDRRMARRSPGAQAPAAKPAAGKVQPAPAPAQRTKGAVYETPKGPMTWTGTGWLPAN